MEDLYRLHSSISCSDHIGGSQSLAAATGNGIQLHNEYDPLDGNLFQQYESAETEIRGAGMSDLIKSQIANHPLYPNLLSAYVQCRKVGAPPEVASLLDEIGKENFPIQATRCEFGADPELDRFMKSYCEVLHRYREELSKPFDEATMFLSDIRSQLKELCRDNLNITTTTSLTSENCQSDEEAGSSDDDQSCGEVEGDESQESSGAHSNNQDLKEMLLRKYSGYLSSLRKEFLKKRKKGKLPKDARIALLDWWNNHCRWPYPTEEEKIKLSEETGLDQKQINNWFINQRKRHWRPSEDMRFALMEGVSSNPEEPMYFGGAGASGTADF